MGAECVSLNVPFQWEHLNLFGLHVKLEELLIKKNKKWRQIENNEDFNA